LANIQANFFLLFAFGSQLIFAACQFPDYDFLFIFSHFRVLGFSFSRSFD